MKIASCLIVMLLAGGLAGCAPVASDGSASHNATTPAISSQQRDALKKGTVTWDDYQAGFSAYRACLAKEGYELVNVRVEYDEMEFGVPGAAIDSGVEDRCNSYYWAQIDESWQIAHEDTSASAHIVSDCLKAHGITPKAKYQENLKLIDANHLTTQDCSPPGVG